MLFFFMFMMALVLCFILVGLVLYQYSNKKSPMESRVTRFDASNPKQFDMETIVAEAQLASENQSTLNYLIEDHQLSLENLAWMEHKKGVKSYNEKHQNPSSTPTVGIYLIEGEDHNLLVKAIQNLHTVLPNWNLTVVGTDRNMMTVMEALGEIKKKKHTKSNLFFTKAKLTSIEDFNNLILSRRFWNEIVDTDFALITQVDAYLCPSPMLKMEEFFQYDYVGAPWVSPFPGEIELVGNCGLCLCRADAIRELINNNNNYQNNQDKLPPDVLFAKYVVNKPSYIVAKAFSVENIWHPNPIGCHKPFNLNKELLAKLEVNCGGVSVLTSYTR